MKKILITFLITFSFINIIQAQEENKGLADAIDEEDLDAVKKAISNGADVNFKDEDEMTPILIAIDTDNSEIVSYLLSLTSINSKDADAEGNNSLHYIADKKNCINLIPIILKKGAAINALNNNDESPLLIALDEENNEAIKLFIENGADVNIKDPEGTPISFYAKGENLKLILSKKPDMNATSADGETLFQSLIEESLFTVNFPTIDDVKILMESGLTVTQNFGDKSVLKFIEEHELEIPEGLKMNDESKKVLEEKHEKQKMDLLVYLKSKGFK